MKNSKLKINILISAFCILHFAFSSYNAQVQEPTPSAPKSVKVPAVKEKKLPNGLTVAVVERKNVPLVTVSLLIRSGAESEDFAKAGLANITASMLTKGTKTRSATQIAEQIEFLGGSINTGAGWSGSTLSIGITSDKLDQAMAILADVVLNPKFDQKELDLLKTQIKDGLAYNLTQPSFLANYVASVYSFDEHPNGGTPESIKAISRADILKFKNASYIPNDSVLIFSGDISALKAQTLAQKYFGLWKMPPPPKIGNEEYGDPFSNFVSRNLFNRLVVIELPNSGQASVNYVKKLNARGRVACPSLAKCVSNPVFYPASVMNSVLGGGYSSRLNQEIRIKRGLSYGAGSGFTWRNSTANFGTRTQTKNESAAEVAELVMAEIKKLTDTNVAEKELNPRKMVVTSDFARDFETTGTLANSINELYSFYLSPNELNTFTPNVQSVTADQIKKFSADYLTGGDIIIVGDYNIFKDDLAKRFPNQKVEIIKADKLDLNKLR